MKNHKWKIRFLSGCVLDLVTHSEKDSTVTSFGTLLDRNGERIGKAEATTPDIFTKTKNPKQSPTELAHAIARRLALEFFTDGKIGNAKTSAANKLVRDHFEQLKNKVLDAGLIPKHVKKHPLNDGCFLYYVGDSLESSAIMLLDEPEKLIKSHNEIKYTGSGIAWCGGREKAILNGFTITANIEHPPDL